MTKILSKSLEKTMFSSITNFQSFFRQNSWLFSNVFNVIYPLYIFIEQNTRLDELGTSRFNGENSRAGNGQRDRHFLKSTFCVHGTPRLIFPTKTDHLTLTIIVPGYNKDL